MMQFISILIGLVCAVFLILGIIPGLALILWGVLLGCVLGIIFGAFCQKKTGLVINIAVGVAAIVRLIIGGGVV